MNVENLTLDDLGSLTLGQMAFLLYLSEQPEKRGFCLQKDSGIAASLSKKGLIIKTGKYGNIIKWQAVSTITRDHFQFMRDILQLEGAIEKYE